MLVATVLARRYFTVASLADNDFVVRPARLPGLEVMAWQGQEPLWRTHSISTRSNVHKRSRIEASYSSWHRVSWQPYRMYGAARAFCVFADVPASVTCCKEVRRMRTAGHRSCCLVFGYQEPQSSQAPEGHRQWGHRWREEPRAAAAAAVLGASKRCCRCIRGGVTQGTLGLIFLSPSGHGAASVVVARRLPGQRGTHVIALQDVRDRAVVH